MSAIRALRGVWRVQRVKGIVEFRDVGGGAGGGSPLR